MRRRPLVRRVANFSWRDAQQRARAGWMRGVRDHHGRVGGQGIQQFFASGDEGFRLCFVEPAGNDFRLVIFETQTMQQRNQSRVAFIDAAKFLRAKGAGLARRTRQRRADPGFRLSRRQVLPSWPNLASPSIPSSSYRRRQPRVVSCQQREPWRPPRRSSHCPRERAHWPVAPADVPPRRPAPKRSGRRGLSGDRKPSRIMPKDESKNRRMASNISDFQ
jgi:hypothetical protein